ncbi:MAG: lysoplasmalogenase [Ferruginibacter sp.]
MLSIARKNIYTLFWAIVLPCLIAAIFNLEMLDRVFKPMLMPALIAAVLLLTNETKGRLKVLAALFFSFLGDVFLLLEEKSTIFFIAGLICFLITHVFYISYFAQIKRPGASLTKKQPYWVILLIFYTGGLLYLILPHLGTLKIPVIAYACIISIMLYYSLAIPYSVNKTVRQLFTAGALFFVISDSLFALNKFYHSFTLASFLIRLTYCLAQYFIVRAFIKKRH